MSWLHNLLLPACKIINSMQLRYAPAKKKGAAIYSDSYSHYDKQAIVLCPCLQYGIGSTMHLEET